ncbi:MAG TPA: hypothetical protein VGR26_07295 [Acidimicrobiales bacterium]|nr:hypothetical protein [Acidimicrobiales bacterium]
MLDLAAQRTVACLRCPQVGGAAGGLCFLGRRSRCRLGAAGALVVVQLLRLLVAEDLVEGNRMAAMGKPRREAGAPRASQPALPRAALRGRRQSTDAVKSESPAA